jgi:hypothetical protein
MSSKRTVTALAFLLAASTLSAAEPAGYKKAYFGATKPGSWAKYTMKMPGFPDSTSTYTRLPDEGGEARLQIRADFQGDAQASTSFSDYRLKAGSLEKDALSFGAAIIGLTVRAGEGEPMVMEPAVLENIRKGMSNYAPAARFVATETVDGKACDHYKYSLKHPGTPAQLESGELWLSETVPFGLVRQTGITKDPSGKVISQFELTLTDSGSEASPAVETARRAAPAAGPLTLVEAYDKEQVELSIEVLANPGDGSRLRVTIKNKGEAPLKLVIPSGASALEVGTPIDTLKLVSDAEKTLEIAPGKSSPPVDLSQAGDYRPVKGRFVVSVYEGTQLFSGSVTMDHVK